MPILTDESLRQAVERKALLRTRNVSARLTESETKQLDSLAQLRGLQRGDCIRDIISAELARAGRGATATAELTEIVGLRLLLATVLKPLAIGQRMTEETFDAIVAEVRRAKVAIATELVSQQGGRK
jgi:hypothetical protein